MNRCLHCGGDGIGDAVSPRAAAIARAVFDIELDRRDWRGGVQPTVNKTSWGCGGPLALVIAEANKILERGGQIVAGDIPDFDVACEHCHGDGRCKNECCQRGGESARRPSMARWMRNYGAMRDMKLMGALRELESGFGDAPDRVRAHDGDLAEHIRKARSIATERGLLPTH